MSTFAVFGMTADVALAEARKTTPTKKPPLKQGAMPEEMSLGEWNSAVRKAADKIMRGTKVRQLSPVFDAPQYAEQFAALARKTGNCRDLRVRAKCALTDAEGNPIINKKTKAPRIGWVDYQPDMTPQVA
ncbi:hypothetical protein PF66_06159 [Pseudomonas asplenii]|uniref:Uncharacterized protein n=1 Tax=Pseudomonas asplenii TaxID=53407 RepID=A0A0M9GC10_9PSED|nr:hypothetical protein [Pseudomonas fuscovaginae]KPA87336.1 hypothetical protein PF66_06159 [Pseudomonas fuscovaginae]